MATSDTKLLAATEEGSEGFESDDWCAPDDSDEDPTFDIFEETRSKFSNISLKKSRKVKDIDSESENGEESLEVKIPDLSDKDGKCFEKVEELIKDGHLKKLKIDQCKVYLRKYGLRLTGNKSILIDRIKEHLEVTGGGGEKKYPISSFVLDCKGDACTGDVVMFEQKVFEMFNIASRSATGPPCGTRVVAGRIVKESYGAAKQQHTFTIEVLWSTGEKPFPPLHPLLIKGRNLYRLKTMRQRWTDEEERKNVLQEKHSRGHVARCSREIRVKEKERRKTGSLKRTETKGTQHLANKSTQRQHPANLVKTKVVQQHLLPQDKENNVVLLRNNSNHQPVKPIQASIFPLPVNHYQHPVNNILQTRVLQQQNNQQLQQIQQVQDHLRTSCGKPTTTEQQNNTMQVPKPDRYEVKTQFNDSRGGCQPHQTNIQNNTARVPKLHRYQVHDNQNQHHIHWSSPQRSHHFNDNHGRYQSHRTNVHNFHHRSPDRCILSPTRQPKQWCRYYRQGRCYYGENCKYLHE